MNNSLSEGVRRRGSCEGEYYYDQKTVPLSLSSLLELYWVEECDMTHDINIIFYIFYIVGSIRPENWSLSDKMSLKYFPSNMLVNTALNLHPSGLTCSVRRGLVTLRWRGPHLVWETILIMKKTSSILSSPGHSWPLLSTFITIIKIYFFVFEWFSTNFFIQQSFFSSK